MKILTMTALVAAQLMVAAQPAMAAELPDERAATSQRHGAFAGARLRVPLGGETGEKARAGLAVAPLLQSRGADGRVVTRFGDGVELGFSGQDKVGLSFNGTRLSQYRAGRAGPDGKKLGVSTIGWVAIGVGAAIVIGYAIAVATFEPCCE
jgi:hypothetical protein